jgi:hypothetical protein
MIGYTYTVPLAATAFTAARTLIQVKAGAGGLYILGARLTQISKTTSEMWEREMVRKTAAATVTGVSPLKTATNDPASLAVSGTSATGINASAEGTDGDNVYNGGWNIINGIWEYVPIPNAMIWVPAAGIIALKLLTAPAASTTVFGEMLILEEQ